MDVEPVRLRIERAARPVRAAVIGRHLQRPERALGAAEGRGRVHRTDLITLDDLQRFGAQRRREVNQVVNPEALPIERAQRITGLLRLALQRPTELTVCSGK